tara:strand:+ start:603 stop:797 length:195 start_codon:yes stop_codon:yes gene_type:complete
MKDKRFKREVMNWIEGMSLELKGRKRMEYIKQQLTAKGHLDGWMVEGLEKELKELEDNERVTRG